MIRYKIRLKGELERCWIEWLDDLMICKDELNTIIEGFFLDKISLVEFLSWLRSINVEVISIDRLE
jgi:hypothetical protein